MECRAKFKVDSVKHYHGVYREITMNAVCADELTKNAAENKSFATATPRGSLTFTISNPNLVDTFQPGQYYYLDFTQLAE